MNTLLQDIRYALRSFAKSPGFTLTALLTATWVPARRATRVDPMIALRAE